MTLLIDWSVTFFAMFLADVCWAFYIKRVNKGQKAAASFWSISLFLAGAVGTINYIHNPWLLIPACLGVASGTYLAIYLDNKSSNT